MNEFRVNDNDIIAPEGQTFWGAGCNVAVWAGVRFNYVYEGRGDGHVDIWPGKSNANAGVETYPGGVVSSCSAWSPVDNRHHQLPDRAYGLNGVLSTAARQWGETPRDDHWHQRILRCNVALRGENSNPDPDQSIPAYLDSIQEMIDLGFVCLADFHQLTGDNPEVPREFLADPTADISTLTGDQAVIDAIRWQDACVSKWGTDGGGTGSVHPQVAAGYGWISLPNEPWASGYDQAYEDFMFALIARARSQDAHNIIAIPLCKWSQDLAGLAEGVYDPLMGRLRDAGIDRNLIWEWHAYGADFGSDVPDRSGYIGSAGYQRIDLHLNQAFDRGYSICVGEYGIATPLSAGNAGRPEHNLGAVESLVTDTYGDPLAEKYSICPIVWHGTGDSGVRKRFKLTHGPDVGNPEEANWFGVPMWDIDGTNLESLTRLGQGHWTVSHNIWDKGDAEGPSITINAPASDFANVVANSERGTRFFLNPGRYTFGNVVPKDGMSFVGEARDNVILDGAGHENAFHGTAAGVEIRNMTFTGFDDSSDTHLQEQSPIRGTSRLWFTNPENDELASDWTIDNIASHGNIASGVFCGNNFTVTNSSFYDNGVTGVGGTRFSGGRFENLRIFRNGDSGAGGARANSGGLKFTRVNGDAARCQIRNCEVFDNSGPGIWLDVDASGVDVIDNVVFDNPMHGIVSEISRNITIAHNTIINNISSWSNMPGDWAGGGITAAESQDVVIQDNVVYGSLAGIVVRQTHRPFNAEEEEHWIPGVNSITNNIRVERNRVVGAKQMGVGDAASGLGEITNSATVVFANNTYDNPKAIEFYWVGGRRLSWQEWLSEGNDV